MEPSKVCAACAKRFTRRKNEMALRYALRQYCSPACWRRTLNRRDCAARTKRATREV